MPLTVLPCGAGPDQLTAHAPLAADRPAITVPDDLAGPPRYRLPPMPASIPYGGSSGEKRAGHIQKAWRRKRLISAQ